MLLSSGRGKAWVVQEGLFKAFGHVGALEAGAIYENRVAKGSKAGRTGCFSTITGRAHSRVRCWVLFPLRSGRGQLQTTFPDGLVAIEQAMPQAMNFIVSSARWVHPDTFRSLPVWYPEHARGRYSFDKTWTRVNSNKHSISSVVTSKVETNIHAGKALWAALGVSSAHKPPNWTVCHIWGDDCSLFRRPNFVVRDPCFYSCVGNMVLLPTPLKGFTDAVPAVKRMLRTCAFHLYGWACEHESVRAEAEEIRSGGLPVGYPDTWPGPGKECLPPGCASPDKAIATAIERRKEAIRRSLDHKGWPNYPHESVRQVLAHWSMVL
ncbi:MAG: hypothetical protein H7Y22_02520 [Gemmatimonadaceae bacterium]|nr:hypothetical protein [Gloeobacterales cyanobacterium ES-bin-141]